MRAKQFFYVCAGILMLSAAYHLGASRAVAQGGGQFAGITSITRAKSPPLSLAPGMFTHALAARSATARA